MVDSNYRQEHDPEASRFVASASPVRYFHDKLQRRQSDRMGSGLREKQGQD